MKKIFCSYSDTHGTIPTKPNQKVDFIIHSGDILGHSPDCISVGSESDMKFQFSQLFDKFIPFFKSFNCPVIFIGGNHDLLLDPIRSSNFRKYKKKNVDELLEKELKDSNVHYIHRKAKEIDGVKFWGSNFVPYIDGRWAFQYPTYTGKEFAKDLYSEVPKNTQVMVCHSPPYQILDGNHYGCSALANKLTYEKHDVKALFCGHCHSSRGKKVVNDITFINSCVSSESSTYQDNTDGNPYLIQSLNPEITEIEI